MGLAAKHGRLNHQIIHDPAWAAKCFVSSFCDDKVQHGRLGLRIMNRFVLEYKNVQNHAGEALEGEDPCLGPKTFIFWTWDTRRSKLEKRHP